MRSPAMNAPAGRLTAAAPGILPLIRRHRQPATLPDCFMAAAAYRLLARRAARRRRRFYSPQQASTRSQPNKKRACSPASR